MTTFKKLCKLWCEREKAAGYKGKRADASCLEYFVGAATALSGAGHPDAEHVTACTMLLIATRGAREVRRIASQREPWDNAN